jgi:Na+-translocating ferredoxin:NAD+ oxidoreductase RnfG subunit
MNSSVWSLVPVAALAVPAPAFAARYMTAEEAMQQAYPAADAFAPFAVSLTHEQWRALDQDAPARVAAREPRAWTASAGSEVLGHFYVDEVLGKQLFITYSVAIGTDGRVLRVEILEYRETHGYEVRNARWLRQFVGANGQSALRLDQDIRNISGATLSCRHVTDGVRRLLALHGAVHAG